jgi:hypothetical protein
MHSDSTGGGAIFPPNTTQSYTALTIGQNYQSPLKPFAGRLSIPDSGLTTHEKNLRIAKLTNLQNAWEVESKKFQVEQSMHNAHAAQYSAMGAAVKAGASLVKSGTEWNKYQTAVADNRVSRSEKNHAIATIPIELEKHSVELEKKKAALAKAKLDLEQALTSNSQQRLQMECDRQIDVIAGTRVTVTLPEFVNSVLPSGDITYDGSS